MAEIIEQSRIPKRTLVDGSKVPAIGLGTFGSDKYNSDQIAEAVYGGIRAGYRMIDCASVYQNENRIGESIERVLKEGIVDRADLFITSKVWNDIAMSKTPHTQYLCMFARHGNLFYHSKFIVTTSSKWYN
ncbi:MAG: aldo/keto reductase [Waltera sp.]|uniref:aldo/keto reductase n=1 Tax=Waltera sp. TaxID=2815806 RepID=UPI003995AE8F